MRPLQTCRKFPIIAKFCGNRKTPRRAIPRPQPYSIRNITGYSVGTAYMPPVAAIRIVRTIGKTARANNARPCKSLSTAQSQLLTLRTMPFCVTKAASNLRLRPSANCRVRYLPSYATTMPRPNTRCSTTVPGSVTSDSGTAGRVWGALALAVRACACCSASRRARFSGRL